MVSNISKEHSALEISEVSRKSSWCHQPPDLNSHLKGSLVTRKVKWSYLFLLDTVKRGSYAYSWLHNEKTCARMLAVLYLYRQFASELLFPGCIQARIWLLGMGKIMCAGRIWTEYFNGLLLELKRKNWSKSKEDREVKSMSFRRVIWNISASLSTVQYFCSVIRVYVKSKRV